MKFLTEGVMVMSEPRDTDERLKMRLNADQAGRERMCMAILALERGYSRIEPRRPEGGPDGGRDIQAIYEGTTEVWGAVGFQNSVTDSVADKRNAKSKLIQDIDAALAEKSDLKAMLFFTNVDFTPGEIDDLRQMAASRGLIHFDVYWRERLRHVLDSPSGLGLRYQYLKIPLSEAEQASFFSNYGRQIEELILSQGKGVQEGVRRLEFLHWMSRPLQSVTLSIRLKRFYTADELGYFRVLAKLFHCPEGGKQGWFIGGQNDYHAPDGSSRFLETRTLTSLFHDEPNLVFLKPANLIFRQGTTIQLSFGVAFEHGTTQTPEIFEGRLFRLFVTRRLVEAIDRVFLELNGYRVIEVAKFNFQKHPLQIEWPEAWPETFRMDPDDETWYGEIAFMHQIDFRHRTPRTIDLDYSSPVAR